MNDHNLNFDAESGPTVEAAFFCESFTKESTGHLTFHRVVQSFPAPNLPAKIQQIALGLLISGLPRDRSTTLEMMLTAPNAIIELGGQTRMRVTIPASAHGLAQAAYNVKDLLIVSYGVHRLALFFDGSTEASHSARFLVYEP